MITSFNIKRFWLCFMKKIRYVNENFPRLVKGHYTTMEKNPDEMTKNELCPNFPGQVNFDHNSP